MFNWYRWCLVSACILGPVTGLAQAEEEELVAFQPKLMVGDAPLDGLVSMQLRLYGSMTSNQILYEDSNTVTVSSGMYSTVLGDNSTGGSITAAIAGDRAYLELVLDGTALPRRPMSAETLRAARQAAVRGGPVEIAVVSVATRQVDLRASRGLRPPPAAAPEPSVELTAGGGDRSANLIAAGVVGATIGGGGTASEPNQVTRNFGTVSGGSGNRADGSFATIGGGVANRATGTRSVIGGGRANLADGASSTVAGGFTNSVAGDYGTIGGGWKNIVEGYVATIGGGWENAATGLVSTVAGGQYNRALGSAASVGGGWKNQALGAAATVPGGRNNTASGDYSLAAGRMSQALHPGSFVWSDSSEDVTSSTGADQFLIRAAGNVGIDVTAPSEKLTVAGNIAPAAPAAHSLGTAQLPWSAVHVAGDLDYRDTLQLTHQGQTNLVMDGNGNIGTRGSVAATAFVGDGSRLTGLRSDSLSDAAILGRHLAPGSVGADKLDLAALDQRYAGIDAVSPEAASAIATGSNTVALRVGDRPVLSIDAGGASPSIVAGDAANSLTPGSGGATISGGGRGSSPNTGDGEFVVIAGGMGNQVAGPYGTISGGFNNQAHNSGSTIGGGIQNTASNWNATVGGGRENTATGLGATIGGGRGNTATNRYATIPGGYFNTASGGGAAVGGGFANTASGFIATVPGGSQNEASGEYSLAAGRRARALHDGTLVWADAADADFTSSTTNQVLFRATGGVGIGTTNTPEQLTVNGNIAPAEDGVSSLGTDTLRWDTLHISSAIRVADGLIISRAGRTLATFDADGNLMVPGEIRARSFQGNMPALTTSVQQATGPLAEDALTRTTAFAGDLTGTFERLTLGAGVVTSTNIADGSISTSDVDLASFDRRYVQPGNLPTATLAYAAALAEVLRPGPEQGVVVPGLLQAGRLAGDGAAITAIGPSAIAGGVLTPATVFDGDLTGTATNLTLRPGAVQPDMIVDGGIGLRQLDLPALDARYGTETKPASSVAPGTITAIEIADGTIGASDLNLTSVDALYVNRDGDTMNGSLRLPEGGLQVGEATLSVRATGVGVGTDEPTAALDVAGTLRIRGGEPGEGKVLMSDSNGMVRWEPLPPPTTINPTTPEDFQFAPVFGPKIDQPLVLQTGGRRALRIEPGIQSPNLIGGSEANTVPPRTEGVTIAGGGTREQPNMVGAPFGTVGGGSANLVKGPYGVVAGGWENQAEGPRSVIGGGRENVARGVASVVAGGFTNTAEGSYAAIGGGWGNRATGYVSTLAGGWGNTATGLVSAVGGGQENRALGAGSTISGGWKNEATGLGATVPGGKGNIASGEFSVAMGTGAQALHNGAFVWKGSGDGTFASTADDQFLIQARGNVGIDVEAPDEKLTVAGTVKADRFIGDGSGLTGLPSAAPRPGSIGNLQIGNQADISPTKIDGVALTERTVFQGAVTGRVQQLALAPDSIRREHLAPELRNALDAPPPQITTTPPPVEVTYADLGVTDRTIPGTHLQDASIEVEKLSADLQARINREIPRIDQLPELTIRGPISAQRFAGDGSALTNIPFAAVNVPSNTIDGAMIAPGAVHLDQLAPAVTALLNRVIPRLDDLSDLTLRGTVTAQRLVGDGAGITNLRFDRIQIPDGGIDGTKITLGSITQEHLADGVWPAGGADDDAWKIGGNRLDQPGPARLGTRDASPITLIVGDQPALRLMPSPGAPSLVGGHTENQVGAGAIGAVVAGGGETGSPNIAGKNHAVVGGGIGNRALNEFATIGGGFGNQAIGFDATIAGGQDNRSAGSGAFIGGGYTNRAEGSFSTVPGGAANRAPGNVATIGGGFGNEALGSHAVVPGGSLNTAAGDYSLAAGRRAKALHPGSFVWADATDADAQSERNNQFVVRASGGVRIASDSAMAGGVALAPGSGSWSSLSDRNAKNHFRPVNSREVLEILSGMPISTWSYRTQIPEVRHLGPVAQDFRDAFGLGEDDTHISTVDIQGVALTAIQGLNEIVKEKAARIEALERENRDLANRLNTIENRLQQVQDRLSIPYPAGH